MDFSYDHDLTDYKDILDRITEQHAQQEQIRKQIDKVDNKIFAFNLTSQQDDLKSKIFFVKAKMFNSVLEIYELFSDEIERDIYDKILKTKDAKYCLLEIYVHKDLQSKVINSNWLLNVTVKNTNSQVCRTLPIKRLTYPHYEIMPFENSVENSIIECNLLLPSENNYTFLQLDKVTVDISYHFENAKLKNFNNSSFYDKVLDISKLYNKEFNFVLLKAPQPMTYSFICKCNAKDFAKVCMKNSYHRLRLESFDELLTCKNSDFTLQFITNCNNVITFNQGKGELQVQSAIDELYKMKLYFLGAFKNKIILNKSLLPELININLCLHNEIQDHDVNKVSMRTIYEEIRQLFFKFPV